jgi:hypothetical protein
MKGFVTFGRFVVAAILVCMALILIGALNLVLNGYHRECGIWRNVVPFACTQTLRMGHRPSSKMKDEFTLLRHASLKETPRNLHAGPKPPNNPFTGRREPWGCGPLQPEPYRIQDGVYHDPGFRSNCGIAHDWRDGW